MMKLIAGAVIAYVVSTVLVALCVYGRMRRWKEDRGRRAADVRAGMEAHRREWYKARGIPLPRAGAAAVDDAKLGE